MKIIKKALNYISEYLEESGRKDRARMDECGFTKPSPKVFGNVHETQPDESLLPKSYDFDTPSQESTSQSQEPISQYSGVTFSGDLSAVQRAKELLLDLSKTTKESRHSELSKLLESGQIYCCELSEFLNPLREKYSKKLSSNLERLKNTTKWQSAGEDKQTDLLDELHERTFSQLGYFFDELKHCSEWQTLITTNEDSKFWYYSMATVIMDANFYYRRVREDITKVNIQKVECWTISGCYSCSSCTSIDGKEYSTLPAALPPFSFICQCSIEPEIYD